MPAWAAVAAAGGFAARVGRGAGLVAQRRLWTGETKLGLTWAGRVGAVAAGHEGMNTAKWAHKRRNEEK